MKYEKLRVTGGKRNPFAPFDVYVGDILEVEVEKNGQAVCAYVSVVKPDGDSLHFERKLVGGEMREGYCFDGDGEIELVVKRLKQ